MPYTKVSFVVQYLLGLALSRTTAWSANQQGNDAGEAAWLSTLEPLEISERLLQLSKDAIDLSALSFESAVDLAEAGYEYYRFFNDEPEQAIVAAVHGSCFAAFRGSIVSWGDWYQNLEPGMTAVCRDRNGNDAGDEEQKTCCSNVRSGFHEAYDSSIRPEFEASLRECLANYTSCHDEEDSSCLVFTGFSSGGAIAHVASLYHADLNPLLITFGQPPTVEPDGCDLFPTKRIYRWVNTIGVFLGRQLYAYDIVASTSFYTNAGQVGHMLVLPPENSSDVAYFGLDPPDTVWHIKPASIMAHPHEDVIWDPVFRPGYRERMSYLIMNVKKYPLVANGFDEGSLCAQDYECQSGRCEARFFAPMKCD